MKPFRQCGVAAPGTPSNFQIAPIDGVNDAYS